QSSNSKLLRSRLAQLLESIDHDVWESERSEMSRQGDTEKKGAASRIRSVFLTKGEGFRDSAQIENVTQYDFDVPWPDHPTDMASVAPPQAFEPSESHSGSEHSARSGSASDTEHTSPESASPGSDVSELREASTPVVTSSVPRRTTPPRQPVLSPAAAAAPPSTQLEETLSPGFQMVENRKRQKPSEPSYGKKSDTPWRAAKPIEAKL
ncbi:hypothetical protein KEM54_004831, partial [Ascosphaera aggregata]